MRAFCLLKGGTMNDYTNLKWITIVIPIVTLTIFEILRFNVLNNALSIISGSILLLVFFALGGFLFSQAVFKYIQQKNNELYYERQRLQALFEHTSDGIIIIDELRRVIDINPAAEKLTGWQKEKVIGKISCCQLNGCFEEKGQCIESEGEDSCLNHECGHSQCWGLTCMKQKSCVPYVEMCLRRKDGIKVPVAASYSYIPAIGDEKPQVKIVFRDISQRKELERAVQTVAVLEERYRISREMHDGLAQDLCLLNMKVKSMKNIVENNDDESYQNEFEMITSIIKNALAEVRQTIFDLKVRPQQMACFTSWLKDCLNDYSIKNTVIANLECEFENKLIFPNEIRVQLARVVQEALNNIRKHAYATEIRVNVKIIDGGVVINIQDNGKGFDINEKINDKEHFGLSIMQERIRLIGGKLEINSKPNIGTTLKLQIPLQQIERKVS